MNKIERYELVDVLRDAMLFLEDFVYGYGRKEMEKIDEHFYCYCPYCGGEVPDKRLDENEDLIEFHEDNCSLQKTLHEVREILKKV